MYPCVYTLFVWNPSRVPAKAVRATMLDDKMTMKTCLLAVKLLRPDPSCRSMTSKVLLKWVRQVLAQYGIRDEDVIGAVTDIRDGVRRWMGGMWPWEECLAHLLNGATVDGTGMRGKEEKSKNLPCRKLLGLIRETVDEFELSHFMEV